MKKTRKNVLYGILPAMLIAVMGLGTVFAGASEAEPAPIIETEAGETGEDPEQTEDGGITAETADSTPPDKEADPQSTEVFQEEQSGGQTAGTEPEKAESETVFTEEEPLQQEPDPVRTDGGPDTTPADDRQDTAGDGSSAFQPENPESAEKAEENAVQAGVANEEDPQQEIPETEDEDAEEEQGEDPEETKKPPTVLLLIWGQELEAEYVGEIAGTREISEPLTELRGMKRSAASSRTIIGTQYRVYRIYNSGSSDAEYIEPVDLDGDGTPDSFPTEEGTFGHVYAVEIDGVFHVAFCANESLPGGHRQDHTAGEYTGPYADALLAALASVRTTASDQPLLPDGPLASEAGLQAVYADIAGNAGLWNSHNRNFPYLAAHILLSYIVNGDTGAGSAADHPDRWPQDAAWYNMYTAAFQNWADSHQDTLQAYRLYVGTVENEQFQDIFWYDGPIAGTLKLQKSSAAPAITDGNTFYGLEGAVYGIYGDAACTEEAASLTTQADGTAGTVSLMPGEWYIKEKSAPPGYALDTEIHKAVIAADEETVLEVSETPQRGGVSVEKWDVEKNAKTAQGNASLEGAVFEIVNANEFSVVKKDGKTRVAKGGVVQEIRTGSDGTAKTGAEDLVFGDYLIREKQPPAGYLAAGAEEQRVRISESGVLTGSGPVKNRVIRGGVKLQKLDEDLLPETSESPEGEGDRELSGAQFAIYNMSAAPVRNKEGQEAAAGEIVQVITTDANGLAQTGTRDLPYGKYQIRETEPSAGYKKNTSWVQEFEITEDGEMILFTDSRKACPEPGIRGGAALQKLDLETGKAEAQAGASLAGIRFRITNVSAHAVKNKEGKRIEPGETVMELVTGDDGKASTGRTDLPYGTYTLEECASDEQGVSANGSYLLGEPEKIVFAIREDGRIVTADINGEEIRFSDPIKRNHLELRKVDGEDRPLGEIPFVITHVETGEQHVIVTDQNGNWDSHKYPVTRLTNSNDHLLEGYNEETETDMTEAKAGASVWFGGSAVPDVENGGKETAPFPYGHYTITELRCSANAGFQLVKDYPFVIYEDSSQDGGTGVVLNNLHNKADMPVPGYTMEKVRIDEAPVREEDGSYGFFAGSTVMYEIRITNTGETDLIMDVEDRFEDPEYFETPRIVNAVVDGDDAVLKKRKNAGVTVAVPKGKQCIVTVLAKVLDEAPEYTAPEAADNKQNPDDGYVNTAAVSSVRGEYPGPDGKKKTVTKEDFPTELDEKTDTANTPVQKTPEEAPPEPEPEPTPEPGPGPTPEPGPEPSPEPSPTPPPVPSTGPTPVPKEAENPEKPQNSQPVQVIEGKSSAVSMAVPVKTGDSSHVIPFLVLLGAGCAAAAVLYRIRTRRKGGRS